MATLAGASLAGCTGPPDEVIIDTRVGDTRLSGPGDLSQPQGLSTRLSLYAEIGSQWWATKRARRAAAHETEAIDAPLRYSPGAPADLSAFEAQVATVREGDLEDVGAALRNLAEAGPERWPEILELLLHDRERSKREYRQVLAVVGGDVPNRYGHFDLHWKKAHGYDVRVSDDWFEDLLALEPVRISKALRPVYREILLTCALLEAASKIGRDDPAFTAGVVAGLLDAAYVHKGTFRDEVGRAIDGLGDLSLPHLMRESVPPPGEREDTVPSLRAAYAVYCLDRMDRLHPRRALEAAAEDRRLLTEVLSAYALVRDGEAAPLLLDYVDADQAGVREAARAAFDAYVEGPLPTTRRKSIRLLGGHTTTRRAALSYREHARLAIRARIERELPDHLEEACHLVLTGGVVDETCERQPKRLYTTYLEDLDDQRRTRRQVLIARALASDDKIAGATLLDTLLTSGDALGSEGPELLAPYYAEVADEAAESGDPARAAQLLRKSAMLVSDTDPVRARALTLDALVLESEVEGLDHRGRTMLLTTARQIDDERGNPQLSAALARLDADQAHAYDGLRGRLRTGLMSMFAGLGALFGLGMLLHRRREPKAEA